MGPRHMVRRSHGGACRRTLDRGIRGTPGQQSYTMSMQGWPSAFTKRRRSVLMLWGGQPARPTVCRLCETWKF